MMNRTKWVRMMFMALLIIALFPTNLAHAGNALSNQLIVLPQSSYNEKLATAMISRIEKIPAPILQTLADKGVKIKLTNDIITNEPELHYLKGVTPRGWEDTGLTWDDAPGVSEQNVVVRIGYSKKGQGHNSFNLEIHETMHAVDRFVFNTVSDSQEFKDIFNKEASLNYHDNYVSAYPNEYFAESASLYVYNDATREQLKKNAPLTFDFMKKLFN